jgi:hypothetical protein
MGRFDISSAGPQFRKWCAVADESRLTRAFIRWQRRERRDKRAAGGEG